MPNFAPKKPVKNFLDLEVYQNSLAAAVFVARYVVPLPKLPAVRSESQGESPSQNDSTFAEPSADKSVNQSAVPGQGDMLPKADNVGSGTAKDLIFHQMLPCALGLPHLIAEAHSVRFGSQKDCLILLERAMLHCNKMVVYLEETRDICDTGVAWDKFNELIKKYLFIRQKTLNLQRSWKKYMEAK
jgi:hypothetical protein